MIEWRNGWSVEKSKEGKEKGGERKMIDG